PHRLVDNRARLRENGELTWLRPDAKSQVTIEYNADGTARRIHAIVLSTQHDESVVEHRGGKELFRDEARQEIIDKLIRPTLEAERPDLVKGRLEMMHVGMRADLDDEGVTACHINPTGCFLQGGPHGDCGLTGRKIIVDTYGGRGRPRRGRLRRQEATKAGRSAP